jgi:hypothetical protein
MEWNALFLLWSTLFDVMATAALSASFWLAMFYSAYAAAHIAAEVAEETSPLGRPSLRTGCRITTAVALLGIAVLYVIKFAWGDTH